MTNMLLQRLQQKYENWKPSKSKGCSDKHRTNPFGNGQGHGQ